MKHVFVICAYKESPYLEECINSLIRQTKKSNIIIVTSTPNPYIHNMANKYEIDYYVNEGQGGITQDWNFGYKCALEKYHSEYITIAHQDDFYETNYSYRRRHCWSCNPEYCAAPPSERCWLRSFLHRFR